jgi:hypothetical protein
MMHRSCCTMKVAYTISGMYTVLKVVVSFVCFTLYVLYRLVVTQCEQNEFLQVNSALRVHCAVCIAFS